MAPTIIITRPERQSRAFANALEAAHGASLPILIAPLMRIDPVAPATPIGPARHVIFTSANAVAQVARLGIDMDATAWCVGDQTAEAAEHAGFELTSAKGNSADLIAQIIAARPIGPMIHLRGAHTTGGVAETLRGAGLDCSETVVYAQSSCPPSPKLRAALADDTPVIAPLFSPRSARLFAESLPIRAPITVVAISDAVAQAANQIRSIDVILSNFPDKTAMIAATLRAFTGQCGRKTP